MKIFLIPLLVLVIGLGLYSFYYIKTSPQFGEKDIDLSSDKYQKATAYKEGRFANTYWAEKSKKIKLSSFFSFFTNGNDKVPTHPLPQQSHAASYFQTPLSNEPRLTWFGHSAVLVEMAGKRIFLDPMLSDVPAPHPWLGASRFNKDLPIAMADIPALDAIVISHDHYDHLDYETIQRLKDRTNTFIVPLGVGQHLESWGVSSNKIQELDWWQETTLDTLKFIAAPAYHFSGRGLSDGNKTLWASWILQSETHNIYFSGDSGYSAHFKEIGQKYGPFDLALIECGQYNEQWSDIHMMPEESVQAGLDLQANLIMPIHWGAFKISLHKWNEPAQRMVTAAAEKGIDVASPIIGQALYLNKDIPIAHWWDEQFISSHERIAQIAE